MASAEGLVKRRRGGNSSSSSLEGHLSKKRSDDFNDSDDEKDGYGKNKLTILEEVLLLGLKDSQVNIIK